MNRCFACGPDNPEGLHLQFDYDAEKYSVQCRLVIDPKHQGATGYSHGGILALLLDEAMAKVNGKGGIKAVTLRLTVSFRKMAPVSQELLLTGRRIRKKGRKLYLRSQIADRSGNLLAEARGLFLEMPRSEMAI